MRLVGVAPVGLEEYVPPGAFGPAVQAVVVRGPDEVGERLREPDEMLFPEPDEGGEVFGENALVVDREIEMEVGAEIGTGEVGEEPGRVEPQEFVDPAEFEWREPQGLERESQGIVRESQESPERHLGIRTKKMKFHINRRRSGTMWAEWDSNLWSLMPYELVIMAILAMWLRIRTIVMIHLMFLGALTLLVLVFNLDGKFGDCLVSTWRLHDCLLASSRRAWFEPFWIGTIWVFVALVLWFTPEYGRAR